jgi:cellobiose-specific phosphotransferase system component IIC
MTKALFTGIIIGIVSSIVFPYLIKFSIKIFMCFKEGCSFSETFRELFPKKVKRKGNDSKQ